MPCSRGIGAPGPSGRASSSASATPLLHYAMRAEIARVNRERPENLDAYDLVIRAIPHVYLAMVEHDRVTPPRSAQ
jgi:hypothetical protein